MRSGSCAASIFVATTIIGFAAKLFGEAGQFIHHDFEIVHRIAAGGFGNIDQMRQQPRPLDVAQKLNAQPVAQVRAFDQPGNIGDHETDRSDRPR